MKDTKGRRRPNQFQQYHEKLDSPTRRREGKERTMTITMISEPLTEERVFDIIDNILEETSDNIVLAFQLLTEGEE